MYIIEAYFLSCMRISVHMYIYIDNVFFGLNILIAYCFQFLDPVGMLKLSNSGTTLDQRCKRWPNIVPG